MSGSRETQIRRAARRRRWSRLGRVLVAGALVLGAPLAAVALGAGANTVTSTSNAALGERIVIDAQGRTLYALNPETTHHLLCKTSECLKFWPPLTVHSSRSLKAGSGVRGHLGVLRRAAGVLQVTLGGHPLYRFADDHAKGQANGQGIHGFGGVWHVITAAPAAPAPAPAAPKGMPGYGY
jgi:predicted lipoprotein with Yx(FWY)xxD motif